MNPWDHKVWDTSEHYPHTHTHTYVYMYISYWFYFSGEHYNMYMLESGDLMERRKNHVNFKDDAHFSFQNKRCPVPWCKLHQ